MTKLARFYLNDHIITSILSSGSMQRRFDALMYAYRQHTDQEALFAALAMHVLITREACGGDAPPSERVELAAKLSAYDAP